MYYFLLTGDALRVWFESMRTTVGRLPLKLENGREITERETWVMSAFDFLLDHIKRIPGRRGPKKKKVSHNNEEHYTLDPDVEYAVEVDNALGSLHQTHFENGRQFVIEAPQSVYRTPTSPLKRRRTPGATVTYAQPDDPLMRVRVITFYLIFTG